MELSYPVPLLLLARAGQDGDCCGPGCSPHPASVLDIFFLLFLLLLLLNNNNNNINNNNNNNNIFSFGNNNFNNFNNFPVGNKRSRCAALGGGCCGQDKV